MTKVENENDNYLDDGELLPELYYVESEFNIFEYYDEVATSERRQQERKYESIMGNMKHLVELNLLPQLTISINES